MNNYPVHINSFSGGMDKDTSYHKYDNTHYEHAENFRIITDEGGTSGSLRTVDGTQLYFKLPDNNVYHGHCTIREYTVLFTRGQNGQTDKIYYFPYANFITDSNNELSTTYIKWSGDLNFQAGYPVEAVGRYESSNIQKVYWTDYYNNIRFCNLVESGLSSKTSNYFNIIPEFKQKPISIKEISNDGSLRAGSVQYSYVLYSVNGSETTFAQATPLIPLYEGATTSNFYDIHGADGEEVVNKAVTITITNPDENLYDKVKVIGIYYNTPGTNPTVKVIGEYGITSSLDVRDGGAGYIGEYTIEEYSQLKNIFAAKTIETKNNYLFAGGIKEDYTDLEYDARAYRFQPPSQEVTFNSFYSIYNNAVVFNKPLVISTTDVHTNNGNGWNDYWFYDNDTIYILAPIDFTNGLVSQSTMTGTELSQTWENDVISLTNPSLIVPDRELHSVYNITTTDNIPSAPAEWDFSGGNTYMTSLLKGATDLLVTDSSITADPTNWGIPLDHDTINPYTDLDSDFVNTLELSDYDYRFQKTNYLTGFSNVNYSSLTSNGTTSLEITATGAQYCTTNDIDLTVGDVISLSTTVNNISGTFTVALVVDGTIQAGAQSLSSGYNVLNFRTNKTGSGILRISSSGSGTITTNNNFVGFMGGEGPNVKYKFKVYDFNEDDLDTTNQNEYYDNVASPYQGLLQYYKGPSTSTDSSLKGTLDNYLSPYRKILHQSFQRDEIYRVGIEFLDRYGRPTFVRWIGDIRTPSGSEAGYEIVSSNSTSGYIEMRPLVLDVEVTITSELISKEITSYRIVRAKRTNDNKTVLDSGLTGALQEHPIEGAGNYIFPIDVFVGNRGQSASSTPVVGVSASDSSASLNGNLNNTFLEYISPEVNFNKGGVSYEGSYLKPQLNLDYYFGKYRTTTGVAIDVNTIVSKKYQAFNSRDTGYFTINETTLFSDTEYEADENDTAYYITVAGNKIYNYSRGADSADAQNNDQARGTCLVLQGTPSIGGEYESSSGNNAIYSLRKRNIIPYGGNTYASRLVSSYIPSSDIVDISGNSAGQTESVTATGDVYLYMFEHLRTMISQIPSADDSNNIEVIFFPVESTFNGHLKNSPKFAKILRTYTGLNLLLLHETKGVHAVDNNLFTQLFDYYDYNIAYNTEDSAKTFESKPLDFDSTSSQYYDTKVVVSEKKYNNELIDSWTKFFFANEIEVDTAYGSITKLLNFHNDLYYFQPRGIGMLSVEERMLQTENPNKPLTLAYSGVLSRYDYLSTTNGASKKLGIVPTTNNVLWYDSHNNGIYTLKHLGEPSISEVKGVASWFNSALIYDVVAGYDRQFNEVIFNFKPQVSSTSGYTLVYNELTDNFTGFYSLPLLKGFISNNNHFVGILEENISYSSYVSFYIHNQNTGTLYGEDIISVLDIVVNPNPNTVNRFDYLEWYTIVKDANKQELNTETFSKIRAYNTYQDSSWILPTKFKRRFREWRLNSLRDYVNNKAARLRDTILKLRFEHTSTSNSSIVINDLKTYYLPNQGK